nr:hypothetical protein Itr_chr02CG14930 [Ipomoea trifida]
MKYNDIASSYSQQRRRQHRSNFVVVRGSGGGGDRAAASSSARAEAKTGEEMRSLPMDNSFVVGRGVSSTAATSSSAGAETDTGQQLRRRQGQNSTSRLSSSSRKVARRRGGLSAELGELEKRLKGREFRV